VSILGIAEAAVAPLVRRLVDAGAEGAPSTGLDRAGVAERFARAAWSCVAEPGDGVAGRLAGALGHEASLQLLLERVDAARLAAEAAAGGDAIPVGDLQEGIKRWTPRLSSEEVLRALRQAVRFGVGLAVPGDQEWPALIGELGDHGPHVLWLRGERARLLALERAIAIVGARAATGYGEHVAVELSAGLVDRGYAIVSGAAYGIDAAAHRAALAAEGVTVAFLAGGLDRLYPSGHEELLGRIIERGLVVSEVPCGTAPTKWRFLQRNRLIAAGSRATVVVEAGWRSGSLNTAGHALALGRPLGAVPGPVTSSASAGCHRLLREDPAVCVTNAAEAAELAPLAAAEGGPAALPAPRGDTVASARSDLDGVRPRLLDALSERSPRTVDRLAALSGLAPDRVAAELGLLELEGGARRRPTGWTRSRG